MKTFYNKVAILGLAGFVLAACGTSDQVVSGHMISKRKVNKGFFIKHSNNPKSGVSEIREVRQPFIQYSPEEEELTVAENAPIVNEQELAVVEENHELIYDEKSDAPGTEAYAVVRSSNQVVKKVETISSREAKTKIDKGTKAEFRQAKKVLRHEGHKDDVRLLILVIICLFIPPLAVYLSEGRWNANCWINLLLTLLFFLPGLIHGLIIILT